jgi:ATP-dependent Clp protease ATP-binding subunit ClpC
VNFKHTVVIMTSNIGARALEKSVFLGFQPQRPQTTRQHMDDIVTSELKRMFNPEFLNRIDENIIFHALSETHIRQIVEMMIGQVNAKLREHGLRVHLSDEAKNWIVDTGSDLAYGARPLQRVIQRHIEDALAENVLRGTLGDHKDIWVAVEEGELSFVEMLPALSPTADEVQVEMMCDL